MFMRRALWNTPKIKPEDFRPEPQDQTLPESPQLPPLTPPTPLLDPQIVYSKRRKRQRTEPNSDTAPKRKHSALYKPKAELKQLEHGVVRSKVEEMQWVPVPTSSSKEQVTELFELLKRDPELCRLCGDTFCRDPTWGDPYLVSCAKCDGKYHSFCVDNRPTKNAWRCYKCQHGPRPGLSTRLDDDPTVSCQFCNKQSPGVAGRLVEYGDRGDTRKFVHENCAFYSKGVTKREDQWFGLHTAVRESHFAKCSFCQKKGASIPCDFPKCRKLFHYICAKHNECYVVEGSSQHLFCDQHMETVLKSPDMLHATSKAQPSFQIPPPSSPDIYVPQSKKKSTRAKRLSGVPDGEDDTPSIQV